MLSLKRSKIRIKRVKIKIPRLFAGQTCLLLSVIPAYYPVIPAKAGIQGFAGRERVKFGAMVLKYCFYLDSRLRGNDNLGMTVA